jgi:predicted CxxxxCH...CXXCH cytochrome family protein
MHIDRLARSASLAFLGAALVSACGDSRPVAEAEQSTCVSCHGGLDNQTGAPPVGVNGESTGPAIGAHTAHVDAGVACESCHVVPDRFGSPDHPSGGRAAITFGGLASAGGASPTYDPATYTCSSVYCHGTTLDAGGSAHTPSWGQVLGACGTCHAYPPPSHASIPEATRFLCSGCHGQSVESDNFTLKKPAHLNGALDFN